MALLTKPAVGTPIDFSHPLMRDVVVALVDYDGFPLDMISGERPSSASSSGAIIDTPCGPAWGYNGSGDIQFPLTDLHNHSVSGEWTWFVKFNYGAFNTYGSAFRCNITTSPWMQYGFEKGISYLNNYIRTGSNAKLSSGNITVDFSAGADCSLAAVTSQSSYMRSFKNGAFHSQAAVGALYFAAANSSIMLGSGFTGAVHVAFAWPKALPDADITWLHEDTWDVFEDSRKPIYVDMAAGSTQDASHVASGGATSGGSADSSREQAAQGSGGATSGGAASTSREVLSTGSGGASTGGAAQTSKEAGHVASGGGVSGGSAASSTGAVQEASHVASGGAVSGGAAASSRESAAQGSGGASAGGSAASTREAVATGQGGASSGGQASQAREAVATGSGGAVSGGAAAASSSTAEQQALRPAVVRLQGTAVRVVRFQGRAARRVRLNPAVFRRTQ